MRLNASAMQLSPLLSRIHAIITRLSSKFHEAARAYGSMHSEPAFVAAWSQVGAQSPAMDRLPSHGADDPDTDADAASHIRWRTVWISDLHLGTPGCQAEGLLDFLKQTHCETLFLVGDIIDGWQLRRSWYWPQSHNDVVQKLLRKARKGTRVVLVPGNHDEFARRYVRHNFGGVEVADEWIHRTADGKLLWVTHGDLFDGVIQCARWLALLGDSALVQAR